ncbi:hypothetical protein O6H91_04G067600 [Diphasiastrum complanatum]|uniref:Uncharacterized protein n=1 Tax=Diphasiastrum complanatum TaxID=34168 RepID=A0ACC2DYG6_DIPCM|nr:hypothetical protein O6H91_04G067600 [Diphasiastrum complanatum]
MMSFEGRGSLDSVNLDRQDYDYRSAMSGITLSGETHPLALSEEDLSSNEYEVHDDTYVHTQDNSSRNNTGVEIAVEPPSYADAVFTPYMGGREDMQETVGSSGPLSSRNGFLEYVTITVTDPQKEQENTASLVPGGNTYFTYLIITHTNLPEYGTNNSSVRRRFRDVVALADRLAEVFRGYFIPPRPDKSVVESQVMHKQEFIDQRRLSLEKYLRRLANHPDLRKSKELKFFLQCQGRFPLTASIDMSSRMLDGAAQLPRQLFGQSSVALPPQEISQPAKGGRDLVRLFKEMKQSFTNDWGSAKPLAFEEDKEFIEKKGKLQDLEHELNEASLQAESLVQAQLEDGEVMGELGLALIKLAKFEIEEALVSAQKVHALDARRIATAAVKASRFYREANAQSVKHLDHLHDYLSMMQAAHAAFSDRSNALLTLQTLLADLSSMNSRVEKLSAASSKVFGGDKSRNRRIEELKESVKITEEACELAQKEYDQIKARNRTEFQRFNSERQRDFFHMLKGFIHTQVGYAEKIAHVWKKVAEEARESLSKSPESYTTRSVAIS